MTLTTPETAKLRADNRASLLRLSIVRMPRASMLRRVWWWIARWFAQPPVGMRRGGRVGW